MNVQVRYGLARLGTVIDTDIVGIRRKFPVKSNFGLFDGPKQGLPLLLRRLKKGAYVALADNQRMAVGNRKAITHDEAIWIFILNPILADVAEWTGFSHEQWSRPRMGYLL